MKIELHDTFNRVRISTHLTIKAAVKKQRKHLQRVRSANGKNSYITYAFRYTDGTPVDFEEIEQAKMELDNA